MSSVALSTRVLLQEGGVLVRLANDARLRKKLFTAEAGVHPAKGHLGLWEAIIERYTEPGQWVLDPMAGIGGTLTAALMGRNVVTVELEHHFLIEAVRSWAKMRMNPKLGAAIGEVAILWGDARKAETWQVWPYERLALEFPKDSWTTLRTRRRKFKLPLLRGDARHLPIASADSIITSPSYEGMNNEHRPYGGIKDSTANKWGHIGQHQAEQCGGE